MTEPTNSVVERIEKVVAEFADLDPRERLELLLEYAANLPALPEKYEAERLAGQHRVHECQTPVFIWTDLAANRIQLHGWVAPESPTVKGFVGILSEVFRDALPEEVCSADTNFVARLRLSEALGLIRMRGLSAIQFYVRKNLEAMVERD